MAEDELDFTSSSFNPLKVLYTAGMQPPVPNVQIFNNINEYAQSLMLGKAVPKNGNQASDVETSDGSLAQRLKNIADNKARSRNRDPSRLAHLMKVKSKTDGIEEKVAMLEKAKKRPQQKNVLQRMEDNYKEGPLSILYNCIEKKRQLRVWTRRLRGVRGICVGYLIAFDKHMNLAMMDVDEMFAIEEEVEVDPVIVAQRNERKKEKKRNWRRKKRKVLRKMNDEQNKKDEMIQSSDFIGEIPGGGNHGNDGEDVQSTLCSEDHVFEFSLRMANADGSRNITWTDGSNMESLQGSNSLCLLKLRNNNRDEVNVKDGIKSMTEDLRLDAGEECENKDPITTESLTFEESRFSNKEGNVKDERELQGLYVGSQDHADKAIMKAEIKETKEETKVEKEEMKNEMKEEMKGEMKGEMKEDSSNTLGPKSQSLNDSSTFCPSSDDDGTGSDYESRNGSSSSDEEGKLKIWEEEQRGSEDEATTDDIQMKRFEYDLNEKHSLTSSSDKKDIWDDGRCSGEGRSDNQMKIEVRKGSVKGEKNIMEGDGEGMLRIMNSDETTPDIEKKEVIENSSKEEDQKGTKSDGKGRLGKCDSSHVHSGEERKKYNVQKKEGYESILKEEQTIARNDEGRLRKWDGSCGESEVEMETFDVEKNEEVNEDMLGDQKITRSDEGSTRSGEEGRLRKRDRSRGDSEEEMVTGEVEKKEDVIQDSLEDDEKITRSDEEGDLMAKDIVKLSIDKTENEEQEEGELTKTNIVKPRTSETKNEEKEEEEMTAKDIVKPSTDNTENEEKEEGELTAKDIVKPTSEIGNEEKKEELTGKDPVKSKTYETREENEELTEKDIVELSRDKPEKEEGELTSSDDEVRVSSCEEGEIVSSGEKEVKNVNRVVRPHQKRSAKDPQSTKKETKHKEVRERSQSDSRKQENIGKTGSDTKHKKSKRFDKVNDVKYGRQQLSSRERHRGEIEDKRQRNVRARTEETRRGDRPVSRAKGNRVGSANRERSTKETKEMNVKGETSATRGSDPTSQKGYKAKKKEHSETRERLYTPTEWTSKTQETTREKRRASVKLSSSSLRGDKSNIKNRKDLTRKCGGTESRSKPNTDNKLKKERGGICETKEQDVLQGEDRKNKSDSDGEKVRKAEPAVKRLLASTTAGLTPTRKKPSKSLTKNQRTTDSVSSSSKQDKSNYRSKHELRKNSSGTANEDREKIVEKKTAKEVKKEKGSLQQNAPHGKKEDGELGKVTKMETLGKEPGHLAVPTDHISKTQKASKYTMTEEKRTAKYSSMSCTTNKDKSAPSRTSSVKDSSKTASDGKAITTVKPLSSKKGQNYCEEGKKITPTEKKSTSSKEDKNNCGEVRKIESLHKKPPSSKKDQVDCGKGRKIDPLEKTPASKKDGNDYSEGRTESLEKKPSFSEKKDGKCKGERMDSVETIPSSSKKDFIHCGEGKQITSQPKPSKKNRGNRGEGKKDTKTVKQNEKPPKNQQGSITATSRRYTDKSRVKKNTDKKDMNKKKTEGDKKKTENKNDELSRKGNSKGNNGVKKVDKKHSLKRKQAQDESIKSLGYHLKDVDTAERPSKVRKVEENSERKNRIKTKEAKLPGKVVTVRVLKVVRGKALVLKKRHVNQLFIRGDNVIMVAYENVNSVEKKL